MIRPSMNGPRSSTVQFTLRPLSTLVTVTTVPNGRVLWAQIPGRSSYHDAFPVSVRSPSRAGATVVLVVVVVVGAGFGFVVVVVDRVAATGAAWRGATVVG